MGLESETGQQHRPADTSVTGQEVWRLRDLVGRQTPLESAGFAAFLDDRDLRG